MKRFLQSNTMHKIFVTFSLLFLFAAGLAQTDVDQALARQYYMNGDYEKAAEYFEKLWKKEMHNTYYYSSLFHSLMRINEYEALESIVKKQNKSFKKTPQYKVDLGYVYAQTNQTEKAQKEYEGAIDLLEGNETNIRTLANKFLSFRLNEYVIKTYIKGNKLLKSESPFAYELGNAYLQEGNTEKAVKYWMYIFESLPGSKSKVQYQIQQNLDNTALLDELQKKLYASIQKSPSQFVYAEMLVWLFTQKKDFESAWIQVKALDKRNKENGQRVYQMARNAVAEQQYTVAIEALKYLIEKGPDYPYYQIAQSDILAARRLQIHSSNEYTQKDIEALQADYQHYLQEQGYSKHTAKTVRQYAELEAYYFHDIHTSIQLLSELMSKNNLPKTIKNEVKLDLGDYYVLLGDVWEATLIYAQVDKDEKDSPIGEDARYRNARLSYYKGEFDWAQAQLTILKGATTELIANDAIQLSIFISDNLGLDTSSAAMNMYAKAELHALQHHKEKALQQLDSISFLFPGNALADDVLFKKAEIFYSQKNYEAAVKALKQLLSSHSDDILGDNATFMLAEIYDVHLQNKEEAQALYKKIILDYSDSVFVVEARKRYRALRGDDV